jgi:hypothetical protein
MDSLMGEYPQLLLLLLLLLLFGMAVVLFLSY